MSFEIAADTPLFRINSLSKLLEKRRGPYKERLFTETGVSLAYYLSELAIVEWRFDRDPRPSIKQAWSVLDEVIAHSDAWNTETVLHGGLFSSDPVYDRLTRSKK